MNVQASILVTMVYILADFSIKGNLYLSVCMKKSPENIVSFSGFYCFSNFFPDYIAICSEFISLSAQNGATVRYTRTRTAVKTGIWTSCGAIQ